jgi:endonuclease/exonuclease/phosphatase family metal-dependent hydrolase
MRKVRWFLYIFLILAGAFALFLLYSTLDDYRPKEVTRVFSAEDPPVLPDSGTFNLLIWNIGYGGLDASMDFFYDGGKRVRPTGDQAAANLEGIISTLENYRDFDMILLQEVDRDSKRSHHTDQFGEIEKAFSGYTACFGMNYRVTFVPVPLKAPMGKVESGLMTLSKYPPSTVDRYSFPGNYAWPTRLFMLDRCFLVERHPLNNGRELVVINTHNSAYDDGTLRKGQMEFLKEFLTTEKDLGNYVIVGGDWNQSPYGIEHEIPGYKFDTINLTHIEKDYPSPDWHWAFDKNVPTNRRVTTPYDRSTSLTTVIDCFLLSPNVELENVQTVNLDFRNSDHQPVVLRVRLNP